MKYCIYCGAKLQDGLAYCKSCGKRQQAGDTNSIFGPKVGDTVELEVPIVTPINPKRHQRKKRV